MRGMRRISHLAVLISGFAMALQSAAQDVPPRLSRIRQMRKGADEWPLILNPRNDPERRINAHLAELNARLAAADFSAPAAVSAAAMRDPNIPETWGKVGRNEPCPCGSGQKYKVCHGQ